MRRIAAIVLAGSLFASASAFAGDRALQPGKPAGVEKAQLAGGSVLLFGGIMAAVVVAIAIGTANENTPALIGTVAPPTTTTTTTATTTTA